ncbi:putative bifunctional diguanylate cyclase/phosphodiesterase [Actinoplanes sp. NPDC049599]|uniref:putative bifunctional diguanylate cyclase/phosphodiesterase n=1 Tax=Actinoplanes sp. NPDC049599 TaxID=3363903 RepID=UPI0037874225
MGSNWSTLQLTEFFSAITRAGDEAGAAQLAVERAAEATEAEIAAVLSGGELLACLGLGRQTRTDTLSGVTPAVETLTVPGLGTFHSTVHPLGGDTDGQLMLGRREGGFEAEERQMLQGMARVLGLALRGLRTLAAERDLRRDREQQAEARLVLVTALEKREQLLETLLQIQRAVSQRAPLQEILDSVTRGASAVADGAPAALVLRDADNPGETLVASLTPGHEHARHDPVVLGAALRAMRKDHPVDQDAVLAAPVHVGGDVAGSLVLGPVAATVRAQERRDVLAAFAEQASLALTGAHSIAAVRQAYHDGLTGLPNRTLFLERLDRALDVSARSRARIAVLFLDLDLFKQVNDTLGHAAGDELLRGVAGRLRAAVRGGDMAARLGGDEFAILLEPVDDPAQAGEIAERISAAVAQPFTIAGKEVLTRASIGIALSDPGTAAGDDLVQDADVAMYRAKKSRPGSYLLFEPGMRSELLRRMELTAEAARAFEAGEFRLAYQPIVALPDARPVAVEALLRWTHPRLGAIPPATFVPLAEQSGLIVALGRWVLREACRELAGWRAHGLPELTVSVNVSGRQLADERLVADVLAVLAETGLPPASVTLEVTETALMRDPGQALRRLRALHRTGVRLAVDDFGSGASSLAHLGRLPIDQLKIDKSFIDGLTGDRRRLAIVRSVLELGSTLELQTVAEGVEDPAQLAALCGLPCDLAQGFLFAEPMPAAEIPRFAARHRLLGAAR